MFTTPFHKISGKAEQKFASSLFFLFIITSLVMHYFNTFLINEIAPYGIISFELAENTEASTAILTSWNELSTTVAGLSLGFDFLYLLVYTLFLALLVHKLNERLWKNTSIYRYGEMLIWLLFITAICDAVENVALIKLLLGEIQSYWCWVAYYFAFAKFTFVIITLLYILFSSIYLLLKKKKNV